jgi:hypothetical protein
MEAVAPPQAPVMPQAKPPMPVNAVPMQAANDYQVPDKTPNQKYVEAVDAGDLTSLAVQAKENFGTPVGQVATHTYGVLKKSNETLQDLAMPVLNAKTPQERNIATADALKSVKDYPQWGTALISFLMGDKKTALNMVTGGQPITTVKYGSGGKQYEYTTDQLGKVISIKDRNGNDVSPTDFEADGGGVSNIESTYRYINDKEINKSNVESLNAGLKGANAFRAQNEALVGQTQTARDFIKQLPNLSSEKISLLTGVMTQSVNMENTTGSGTNTLGQRTEGVTGAKSTQDKLGINAGIGGAGAPEGSIAPSTGGIGISGGNVKANSLGTNANELNQSGTTGSKSDTTGARSNADQQALAKEAFLKDVPAELQQKYIAVWDAADSIGRSQAKLEKDGYRIPSFITAQSPTNLVEGTPALEIRLLKPLMNQELNSAFNRFYQENIGAHVKNGRPPSMEEMEAAFTKTTGEGSYKEIISKYTAEAKNIIKSSRSPSIEVKYPEDKPDKTKPVAPPKAKAVDKKPKRSLEDIQKGLGD